VSLRTLDGRSDPCVEQPVKVERLRWPVPRILARVIPARPVFWHRTMIGQARASLSADPGAVALTESHLRTYRVWGFACR
jgi:hypothetical protein